MEQPGFWAVLPANVRYDRELTPNEKILYTEITAMTQAVGYCYASNKYFASLYGVAEPTIRRYIQHLREQGYIQVMMEGNERRIYQVLKAPDIPEDGALKNERGAHPVSGALKNERGPAQNRAADPLKNERKNNTRDNNNINNTGAGARAKGEQKWSDVFLRWATEHKKIDCGLCEALMDFGEFRQSGKHPLTARAAQLSLRALDKLAEAVAPGLRDAYKIDVLNQSIQRGWEGLFKIDNWSPEQPVMVHRGSGEDRPRMIGGDVKPEDLF